jgi:hypothetical protein
VNEESKFADAGNYLKIDQSAWRLVTDSVMGGRSNGSIDRTEKFRHSAMTLSGRVSTENNGGFIQMVQDIPRQIALMASRYEGIRLNASGNGETYNIHLRTTDLWLPWQAYRANFTGSVQWQTVDIPFEAFSPHKISGQLNVGKLKRIAIVAIGRDFDADVSVAEIGFYRN